jgi:hypothetical protein
MAAVPLIPSLVAVIVAEPTATPVTRPALLTLATLGLPLAQVTTRPLNGAPAASRGVADNCVVAPTCTLAEAGVTVTELTGTTGAVVTVILAVPLRPSLVAVIVADPGAAPVTSPLPLTVAMLLLLLDHVTTRPGRTPPTESSVVAES